MFFSQFISEVNKFSIYMGFCKYVVKLGFIDSDRDNNVSFSCVGRLIAYKTLQFNSLKTRSPRHSH